jgi:hypothetical protein
MRRASWLFLAPLLFLFGCQRPEVEAFRQRPTPVSVTVTMPSQVSDRDEFQREYAAALRARLATRLVVVPEGVRPPVGAAQLQVDIRDLSPGHGSPSPSLVGATTGVAVGLLSAAAGNREGAFFDGLFWGLWAGSQASADRDRTEWRLGYRPTVVGAEVRLVQPGNPEPLWVASIDPHEVVDAMDPLPPGSRDDDGRIREEEAKGFARVVVRKLTDEFGWMRVTEQRFYDDPAAQRVRPEPKPAPAAPVVDPKAPAAEPKRDQES